MDFCRVPLQINDGLFEAIKEMDIIKMRKVLAVGASVDNYGSSIIWSTSRPLEVSAFKNHLEGVQLLLQHGASVNLPHQGGWTPLHSAAFNRNPTMVALLLANGANPSTKTFEAGLTPLDVAKQQYPMSSPLVIAMLGRSMRALF